MNDGQSWPKIPRRVLTQVIDRRAQVWKEYMSFILQEKIFEVKMPNNQLIILHISRIQKKKVLAGDKDLGVISIQGVEQFFNLSTVDIQDRKILCRGRLFCPLDDTQQHSWLLPSKCKEELSPVLTTQNIFRHWQISPEVGMGESL